MTMGIPSAIHNYDSAQKAYSTAAKNYRDWVQSLYVGVICFMRDPHAPGAISPSLALWLFQTQLMPTATNGMEYNLEEENTAIQVSDAVRSQVTGIQNTFNRIINDIEKGISTPSVLSHGTVVTGPKSLAQKLSQQLKNFSQLISTPSLAVIMGASNLNDYKGYIKDISLNLYGGNQNIASHWNSYQTIHSYHQTFVPPVGRRTSTNKGHWTHWSTQHVTTIHHSANKQAWVGIYSNLLTMWNQAAKQGQTVSENFTGINSDFSNLNQSVSGVSSFIQTQMQYLNQNLQQYFSIYNNFFSDYNTLNSYIVSKSIGS